jgi:catechol 2,3-dioxygenase-like lactoylglutathione lyase family enzyme
MRVAPVLPTPDLPRTIAYYRDVLGFGVEEHLDREEPFAALYRGDAEIILVAARRGKVAANRERFGGGFDLYLVPGSVEEVDDLFEEWRGRGATVVEEPTRRPYGSYEMVVRDVDGRLIGVGRIADAAGLLPGQQPQGRPDRLG